MQVYISILSVISGMMLMAVGAGMMTVFTPTVLGAAGFGTELIGVVVTANAATTSRWRAPCWWFGPAARLSGRS